jgi:hypothetical protein
MTMRKVPASLSKCSLQYFLMTVQKAFLVLFSNRSPSYSSHVQEEVVYMFSKFGVMCENNMGNIQYVE